MIRYTFTANAAYEYSILDYLVNALSSCCIEMTHVHACSPGTYIYIQVHSSYVTITLTVSLRTKYT